MRSSINPSPPSRRTTRFLNQTNVINTNAANAANTANAANATDFPSATTDVAVTDQAINNANESIANLNLPLWNQRLFKSDHAFAKEGQDDSMNKTHTIENSAILKK